MSGYPHPGEPPSSHHPLLSTRAPKRVLPRALVGLSALLAIFAGALVVGGPALADEPYPGDGGTVAVAPTPSESTGAGESSDLEPGPPTEASVDPPLDDPSQDASTMSDATTLDEPDPMPSPSPSSGPYTPSLSIEKTHDELPAEPIEDDPGQRIPYRIVVTNTGQVSAINVSITDQLPLGLTADEASVVAPAGWSVTFPGDDLIRVDAPGPFLAGEEAVVTFDAIVGELPRDGIGSLIDDLVNFACVEAYQLPQACDDDTIRVKSIAMTASAVCLNNTPYVSYTIQPDNVGEPPPPVAMIWWTADAYAARDPGIDAGDSAALLADGASQVDYVPVPGGWTNGTPISGQQLWPGAAVDAGGNPTDWPGWTELPDGTWILDPAAPFYDLRLTSVVEFRIKPTVSTAVDYPPASEECAPSNPQVDLTVTKTHGEIVGDAVDSGGGDVITYTITITNNGTVDAHGVSFVDTLPPGLVADLTTVTGPTGWTFALTPDGLSGSTDDPLAPAASVVITFGAVVGELPRAGTGVAVGDVMNLVCVDSTEPDMNPEDNCATDVVRTKSIALSLGSLCRNDTPFVTYSIVPTNIASSPPPVVALIWWTPSAYAARDPNIDAGDEAAILADGALEVQYLTIPGDWTSGLPLSGEQLWPGAAVDADGNPTDWPGWSQDADGNWFLDPSDPFFALRTNSIVEFRINPTVAAAVTYPPATASCVAGPPGTPEFQMLAATGAGAILGIQAGAILLVGGAALASRRRRRRV